jgi:hypothetical protein
MVKNRSDLYLKPMILLWLTTTVLAAISSKTIDPVFQKYNHPNNSVQQSDLLLQDPPNNQSPREFYIKRADHLKVLTETKINEMDKKKLINLEKEYRNRAFNAEY